MKKEFKINKYIERYKKFFNCSEKELFENRLTPQEEADLKYITWLFDPNRIELKLSQ